MLHFINNFLTNRHFEVKTRIYSFLNEYVFQHGVSQGSVISATLFNIAINHLLNLILSPIPSEPFTEDNLHLSTATNC